MMMILKMPMLISESGLELKKISKSSFGDYRKKNGRQMQKCSCQIVQEQKLKLEPHLISIVFRLPVDFCTTTLRTTSARQPYVKQ